MHDRSHVLTACQAGARCRHESQPLPTPLAQALPRHVRDRRTAIATGQEHQRPKEGPSRRQCDSLNLGGQASARRLAGGGLDSAHAGLAIT